MNVYIRDLLELISSSVVHFMCVQCMLCCRLSGIYIILNGIDSLQLLFYEHALYTNHRLSPNTQRDLPTPQVLPRLMLYYGPFLEMKKKKLILRKFLVESVNFMCITCFDLYIPQHTHSNRHIKINKKLARKFRYMKHRLQINICKSFHFILLSVRINSIFHFIACTFAHLHKLQSTQIRFFLKDESVCHSNFLAVGNSNRRMSSKLICPVSKVFSM